VVPGDHDKRGKSQVRVFDKKRIAMFRKRVQRMIVAVISVFIREERGCTGDLGGSEAGSAGRAAFPEKKSQGL
jgi:hypothetical protein